MKRTVFVLLLISFFGALYPPQRTSAQDNIKEITILHWNDFHARNVPYKISKTKDGETTQYYVGGTGSVLGYLNKFRNDKSLVINAGDDFQGSPISSITKGMSQIELLNLYSLDAFVAGNHEFDYGAEVLKEDFEKAKFDVLSANLYDRSTNKLFGKQYIIKEKNGIKVGIIGVSPEDLKSLTLPKNVETIDVLNTDSVIAACLPILKKEKCDMIVLLSHNGVERDSVFAEKFHGDIDVIVGGHSHTVLFKPKVVQGTLIVQAGSYGRNLGKLDLKVNTEKDTIAEFYGKLHETILDSAIFDKAAGEKVDAMIAAIEPEMKRVIGKLEADWKRDNFGQWNADALRAAFGANIAFLNSGSVRKEMLKGDITVGDIWEISPFGNNIMKFKLNGSAIKKMMANNIRMAAKDETLSSYDVIIFSGMTIRVNTSMMNEQNDDFVLGVEINGSPLDEQKEYTVVTNSYCASQAAKYFGDFGAVINAEDTNVIDRDVIMEAVQKQKVINNVYEKRLFNEK